MHIKTTDEQSSRSRVIIHLTILLAISFCVGVYLISTTVLIAQDGITFIEYARGLETSPLVTMKSKYQHPGYPFLIADVHKMAEIVQCGSSIWSWIYSAQAVALIFRLFTVALLYFAGRKIVGQRFSFWAILILILLPDAAEYGSDALSDWPHIFFLSAGFLLLVWAAVSEKWWLFGFSGIAAGMGYLVRPECAQVVVFGTLWSGLQLFWSQRTMSKYKAVFALALLLAGFLIIAGPYMNLKGGVFPKKQLVQLVPSAFAKASDSAETTPDKSADKNRQSSRVYEQEIQTCSNNVCAAGIAPSDVAKALGKLGQRVGETLMWFFVPALLIGMYKHFGRRSWYEPERFFVVAFITLNVLIMILLYRKFGYMSRRHTLPLVVLTIFYVPIGLEALASWLDVKLSKTIERLFAVRADTDFWFSVLLIIGIFICSPKLLRPIRIEKQSYRDAALWLAKNTGEQDIIAVPDIRIGFYSGRSRSIEYDGRAIPKEAQYVVKLFEDEQNTPSGEEMLQTKEVFSVEGGGKEPKIIIYRREH
jgi:hypothetical protein